MRNYLFLILLFFSITGFSQTLKNFGGTINVFAQSGTAPNYSITGFFNDPTGLFASEDLLVNDIIYAIVDGVGCTRFQITSITSDAGGIIAADVTDLYSVTSVFPLAIHALMRETANNDYPIEIPQISEELRACITTHFRELADLVAAGVGQANTASNIGVGGVGLFEAKVGVDLQFKNVSAGSNKVTVTHNVGNKEAEIDIVPSNINTSGLNNDAGFITTSTAYDNDAGAAIGGVSVGEFYELSSTNTMGGIPGTIKKRKI